MNVHRISAVTFRVKDMKTSYQFYSRLPGFRLAYGGPEAHFTSFKVGNNKNMYMNLELAPARAATAVICNFGRIIFHTGDVDELYRYIKNDDLLSSITVLEGEPRDAAWGERFFHLRDPDGYQLSFAKPL